MTGATPASLAAMLIRHFSGSRVSDFIRITIGSEAGLDRLTDVLAEFLATPSKTI